MSKLDCMVDIETLGTRANSILLSAAFVTFDTETFEFKDELAVYFDWREQKNHYKRSVDPDTVKFWKDQDPEVWKKQSSGTTSLKDGLNEIKEFTDNKDLGFYWAWNNVLDFGVLNDVGFDAEIDLDVNKRFYSRNCMATLARVIGELEGNKWLGKHLRDKHRQKIGDAHDALADCKVQILTLKDLLS